MAQKLGLITSPPLPTVTVTVAVWLLATPSLVTVKIKA